MNHNPPKNKQCYHLTSVISLNLTLQWLPVLLVYLFQLLLIHLAVFDFFSPCGMR